MTHLLKLLDEMCKYEMDPMSIVEDTERTRFCPQTDRQTDGWTYGQTNKVKPVYFIETEEGSDEILPCWPVTNSTSNVHHRYALQCVCCMI